MVLHFKKRLECYTSSCILTRLFNCFHLSEQIYLSEQTFVRCVQRCSDNRGCTVQFIGRYADCRRMYRHQDLPSEVETGEIEVADGSDCGPVEDVTMAVEGRWEEGKGERGRKRYKYVRCYQCTCELSTTHTLV